MKKKIINGFLMVALLAATVTSFVSCKDNDEDVKTDLIAQLQKQATDLTVAYKQADNDLNTTIQAQLATKANQTDLDDFKTLVASDYVTKTQLATTLADYATKEYVDAETKKLWDALNDPNDPSSVSNKIAAVNEALEDQAADIEDIQEDINDINDELTELKSQIHSIIETLENLVTSVTVNATSNSILNNSKLFPGINMQFVGAAYGEPDVKKGTFPTDFVDADLVKVSEGKEYKWTEDDFINSNENEFNAGKIYFTLNPSNITPNNVNLALVNSVQTELFKIGKATKCEETLSWGLTRGVKDANYPAVVYEAPVTYDATTLKAIELKNVIDIKAIAKNVKNIINEAKGAAKDVNRSNYEDVTKATGKAVLKEAAQAVANLVNINMPYMPAVALKATWSDTVGTRSVLSDYSIAATAYKPMSFKEFDGVDLSGYSIDFAKVDNAVLRVVNKIKSELNKFDLTKLNFKKISFDTTGKFAVNQTVYLYTKGLNTPTTEIYFGTETKSATEGWSKAGEFKVTADFASDVDAMIAAVNAGVPFEAINDLVAQVQNTINRVNDTANRAANFEKRVTNYLEYMIQRVLNNANRALEPILLVDGSNGMQRATGTYEAGKHTFVPTSITYELVAPAFQKYIAVCGADGKARWGKVMTKGKAGFNKVDVDLQAGDTKIVYAALDFKGNTITKVYSINVK
jgi:peptidoglycan hydrolase CwlO-like protein